MVSLFDNHFKYLIYVQSIKAFGTSTYLFPNCSIICFVRVNLKFRNLLSYKLVPLKCINLIKEKVLCFFWIKRTYMFTSLNVGVLFALKADDENVSWQTCNLLLSFFEWSCFSKNKKQKRMSHLVSFQLGNVIDVIFLLLSFENIKIMGTIAKDIIIFL